MELTIENLKKYKNQQRIKGLNADPIVKEMKILLTEEIDYLNAWSSLNELQGTIIVNHMKERIDFIQTTLNKLN